MKKPSAFVQILLALFLLPSTPLAAKVLKIATISPEGSSWMKTMRGAAKKLEAQTDGRVKLKFYPGGVMGNDQAVLRKIRIRQLHGAALTGGSLRSFYPDVEAYSLPLLFRSFAEVDYVRSHMDSQIISGLQAGGMVSYGLAEGGLAYAMSDSAVVSIADLKGKKVWVPTNDRAALQAVKAFDVSPFPLDLSNVLVSLQTGMINSVATSPIAAIALQWHTQVKYITDLPLMYFFGTLVISERALKGIDSSDRELMHTVLSASIAQIDKQNRIDNEAAMQALRQQGLRLVGLPETERTEWYSRAQLATQHIVQSGLVSQDFYRTLSSHLAEFRSTHGTQP